MSVTPIQEAGFIDLTDDELKAYLLGTHERIKNIEDEKKKDPDIEQMRQKLKDYINDNYDEELKSQRARLKAARAHAKGRKLKIELPGE